jgi:SAM-dependent methyltransferase
MVLAKVSELADGIAPAGDGWEPTVDWWGERLPVFRHLYNTTWLNERGAELAVVQRFLSDVIDDDDWVGAEALEVGNVCGHYDLWQPVIGEGVGLTVVDRYEAAKGVRNIDVFDVVGRFDLIVSVSTLEHVRFDPPEEPEADGAVRAIEHLRGLLAPGGRMLVTVPTGHNPALDAVLVAGETGADRACTLVRDMESWRRTETIEARPYGRTQPWAEAVWIGEFSA